MVLEQLIILKKKMKKYNPSEIEKKWQSYWIEKKTYKLYRCEYVNEK